MKPRETDLIAPPTMLFAFGTSSSYVGD